MIPMNPSQLPKVFKYVVEVGYNRVPIPESHSVLMVASVNGQTVIYAIVDPSTPNVDLDVNVFLTGERIPVDCTKYVGSAIHRGALAGSGLGNDFVVHVFI